jgi:tRNA dimethylallyltransferase
MPFISYLSTRMLLFYIFRYILNRRYVCIFKQILKTMIFLYGPTGTGKSDLAITLAQHIPVEIINMDVGQFYTPLTIGTAKPDWRSIPIRHHLFDYIATPTNYTVIEYKKKLLELVCSIRARGNMPLVVGGSGFYLKSLFFTPHRISGGTMDRSIPLMNNNEMTSLWEQLHAIDPARAGKLQPHDTYRIMRALDIWHTTGTRPSDCKPSYSNDFGRYAVVGVMRERTDLHQRIEARVHTMFAAGWIDEVRALDSAWIDFIRTKKIIGYNEIVASANSQSDDEHQQLVQTIQIRTRQYARRQIIFWRMLKKELYAALEQAETPRETTYRTKITEINLTSMSHDIYLKQLLSLYNDLTKKD